MSKNLHRRIGRHKQRSADEADISTILAEFTIADQLLDTLCDAARAFQLAWRSILASQLAAANHLESLYQQIYDAESENNTETDPRLLEKAMQLKVFYTELDNDLQQETGWIQSKILGPAMDAKQSIGPIKKQIKKRENYKLDFERYQSRVDSAKAKARTPKDEMTLAKYETELSQGTVLYRDADEQIRRSVPAVIDAMQSLVPLLLKTQIMLQHALVGQLYTVTHEYCQHVGLPSPAPPMQEVIAEWDRSFTPFRLEVEKSLQTLVTGKTVYQPFRGEEKAKSYTGLGIRSKVPGIKSSAQAQRPPAPKAITYEPQSVPENEEAPPPKPPRPGNSPAIPTASKPRTSSQLSVPRSLGTPLAGMAPAAGLGIDDAASSRRSSVASSYVTNPESPRPDYLSAGRSPSQSSIASSIAAKKKPPPPPIKRQVTNQDMYVTALYTFAGQGGEDLSFREGDRIKVLKKTNSTDDWWLGELRGLTGQFPANYVQ